MGLKRFVPAEIVFVIWNADTMPLGALEELQELLALSVKSGTWPVTQDDTFWQQYKGLPATVTADPLCSVRASHTVKLKEAVSLAIEEQEEAAQASQELADAKEEGRPPKTWACRGIRYAAPTLMNGPWQALRWWRTAPDGLGATPA